MKLEKYRRFASANKELTDLLTKVDSLARGTESITERDLQNLSQRLATPAPEVGDASRGAILDKDLQREIGCYVTNLRALHLALEKVHCILLARKLQLESAKRHSDGLPDWIRAYSRTT